MRSILSIAAAVFAFVNAARADIFQWEYINPADPSQGKRQSTTLAPNGAGVDAVPGANLFARDLTMAHLIGANLMNANGYQANLTNADLSQANLTNADFTGATLIDADFTDAEVWAAHFSIHTVYGLGTGISLAQLYSTASYRARDLSGIELININLSGGQFAGQILVNANLSAATLTGANFREANLTNAYLSGAALTDADLSDANLTKADVYAATLTNADLSDANLTNANFLAATLTGADFTDADVRRANFDIGGGPCVIPLGATGAGCSPTGTGVTVPQLYSTASYQVHDLSGIECRRGQLGGRELTPSEPD